MAKTILCVEDEDALRHDLVDELEFAGYEVLSARDGKEALAILHDATPALIICDMTMPKMNGKEMLRELRNIPRLRQIPLLFSSAHEDLHKEFETEGGQLAFLPKPIDFGDLLHIVEATVNSTALMSPIEADPLRNAKD